MCMVRNKWIGMILLLAAFFFVEKGMAQSKSGEATSASDGAWHVVRQFPQKSFNRTVPPGNYSGITHLRDDIYGIVSDKSDSALFFNFRILLNMKSGELEQVENFGFDYDVDGRRVTSESRTVKEKGLDHEAIAKVSDSTVVIASEGKFRLKEYAIVGENDHKFWEWSMPSSAFYPNYGFESLAYDSVNRVLWTVSESSLRQDGEPATPQLRNANRLRFISFDWKNPKHPVAAIYAYQMDKPSTSKSAETYVMGVSELCVLPDGKLVVLEREAFIPKIKIGAFCHCKLYVVDPQNSVPLTQNEEKVDSDLLGNAFTSNTSFMNKTLLTEWNTSLTLLGRSFANYEGMCLGPQLEDGSQVLILVSDSQDQYAHVLKDWFKTIVISNRR